MRTVPRRKRESTTTTTTTITEELINDIGKIIIISTTYDIKYNNMGGIIDFNTDCPWQLYLFAFIHIFGGIFMYFFDTCKFLAASTACAGAEKVFESLSALCFIYVGAIVSISLRLLTLHEDMNNNNPIAFVSNLVYHDIVHSSNIS